MYGSYLFQPYHMQQHAPECDLELQLEQTWITRKVQTIFEEWPIQIAIKYANQISRYDASLESVIKEEWPWGAEKEARGCDKVKVVVDQNIDEDDAEEDGESECDE